MDTARGVYDFVHVHGEFAVVALVRSVCVRHEEEVVVVKERNLKDPNPKKELSVTCFFSFFFFFSNPLSSYDFIHHHPS